MSKKQGRGFTLIELLAVIIMLAVIVLITTPVVLKVIEESRKEAYRNSSLNAIKTAGLYEASNEFVKIDENGIDIINLEMDNNNFTSGKIIRNKNKQLELVNVTDGVYCAKGTKDNLKVVKGSCVLLDDTAPINIVILEYLITTNSIKIVINADDLESGIKRYHYSFDGINYETSDNSVVEIMGLENNKTYKIYVKVENNNGIISEVVEREITTKDIQIPTYAIDKMGWSTEKIVTITYPEKQSGFVYEYSIDGGSSWTIVESGTTASVTFTSNGSVIARVYDETNYKTASTYNVTQIDTTVPTVTLTVTNKTTNSITVSAVGTDNESGIVKYEFAIDNGSYVSNGTNGTYIFKNVTTGTHTLKVRVTNGTGLTKEASTTASPNVIETPTYSVDKTGWATKKIVTITYPERQSGFVYQYSLDSGSSWTTVESATTASLTFTSNGSVIARIYDGTNYNTASSYTASQIDPNAPTITAKGSSYTITQGGSNVISSTYFNISANGSAPITTTCVDTSNNNVSVTNTSTLSVGAHVIKCTVTKENGLSANAQTTIIVNSPYYCSEGTLTYDSTLGYVCVKNASSSSYCNSCSYSTTVYGQNCSACGSTCNTCTYTVETSATGTSVCTSRSQSSYWSSTDNTSSCIKSGQGCKIEGGSDEYTYCSVNINGGYDCYRYYCSGSRTDYSCPSGYTLNGTKCVKQVTEANCTKCGSTCNSCNYQTTTYGQNCSACGSTCNSCYYSTTTYGTSCSNCGSYTSYYCPSGWSTYSGSGSNLKCYKAATLQ